MKSLQRVQTILGYGALSRIAKLCDVTPGAVKRWFDAGVLPASEITEVYGERQTEYGKVIEQLTNGEVTDEQLRKENFEFRQLQKSAA